MTNRYTVFLAFFVLCLFLPACSSTKNKQKLRLAPYELIDYPDQYAIENHILILIIDDEYLERNGINKYEYERPLYYYTVLAKGHAIGVYPREESYPQGPIIFMMNYLNKGYVKVDEELRDALMAEGISSISGKIYRDDPLFAQALFYMAARERIFYWNINKIKVFSGESYHYEHRYKLPPERYNVGW